MLINNKTINIMPKEFEPFIENHNTYYKVFLSENYYLEFSDKNEAEEYLADFKMQMI